MGRLSEGECLAIERRRLAGMAEAKTEGKAKGKAETLSRQLIRRSRPAARMGGPVAANRQRLRSTPLQGPPHTPFQVMAIPKLAAYSAANGQRLPARR